VSVGQQPPAKLIMSGTRGAEAVALLREVHAALNPHFAPPGVAHMTDLRARVGAFIAKAEART